MAGCQLYIATRLAPGSTRNNTMQHSYTDMLLPCSHGCCCPNRSHLKAGALSFQQCVQMAMLIMANVIGHTETRSRGRGERFFGVDPSKNPRDKSSPSDENKNTLS